MSQGNNPYNPYSGPTQGYAAPGQRQVRKGGRRRAEPGKRILAFIFDGLIGIIPVLPMLVLMIIGGVIGNEIGGLFALLGFAVFFLGCLGLAIYQIYLLATESRTLGKKYMKLRIMDQETNRPASFVQTFLLRGFVHNLIGGLPLIGIIYVIVDIVYLFNDDHLTLHDQLAKTWVADEG